MYREQLEFQGLGERKVVGRFNGGTITSDVGALILREIDLKDNFTKDFSEYFADYRNPDYIEHSLLELLSQEGDRKRKC